MPTVTPELLVEAPPVTPYQYGLAAVAVPADTGDPHWANGVIYEPIATYEPGVLPGGCYSGVRPAVALSGGAGVVSGLPFAAYAGVDCKAVGYDEAFILARARAILQLGWQHAAEVALWTGGGVTGLAPVLNGASVATTVGSGAVSITDAVALLEAYMASNYLGTAVFHAPRGLAAYAQRYRQIVERVGKLQTVLGSSWVFGGGYDGTGPGDAAPASNTLWMYATGLVTVRRGEAVINGGLEAALNRSTNQAPVYAQEPIVLTVEGPIAAVSVDLTK